MKSRFLLGLLLVAACGSEGGAEECLTPPLAIRGDTVVRFWVDGRSVVFGTSDDYVLELDTVTKQLTLLAIRQEGSYYLERAIRVDVAAFSGPGIYPMGGPGDTAGASYARYWCPVGEGAQEMYVAAGQGGDIVNIRAFDSTAGSVEGLFQFHAEPFRGDAEVRTVTRGYFHGTVTRVGDGGVGDAPERRP